MRIRNAYPSVLVIAGVSLALAILLLLVLPFPKAHGLEHGWDKSDPIVQWFEHLMEPDHPSTSCCGKADAYEADRYIDQGDHFDVWITEGSAITFPDGTKRAEIPNGTQFRVPRSKVNPPADGNPTKHAWLFSNYGSVYCFVPIQPNS